MGELLVSGQLLGAHLCFMADGLHRVCGWTGAADFVCVRGKPYGPGVPVGTGVLWKKGGGVRILLKNDKNKIYSLKCVEKNCFLLYSNKKQKQ